MSLASPPGAVATDWSLRPVSAAPPFPGLLPNALENADDWDMMKVFAKSQLGRALYTEDCGCHLYSFGFLHIK